MVNERSWSRRGGPRGMRAAYVTSFPLTRGIQLLDLAASKPTINLNIGYTIKKWTAAN